MCHVHSRPKIKFISLNLMDMMCAPMTKTNRANDLAGLHAHLHVGPAVSIKENAEGSAEPYKFRFRNNRFGPAKFLKLEAERVEVALAHLERLADGDHEAALSDTRRFETLCKVTGSRPPCCDPGCSATANRAWPCPSRSPPYPRHTAYVCLCARRLVFRASHDSFEMIHVWVVLVCHARCRRRSWSAT